MLAAILIALAVLLLARRRRPGWRERNRRPARERPGRPAPVRPGLVAAALLAALAAGAAAGALFAMHSAPPASHASAGAVEARVPKAERGAQHPRVGRAQHATVGEQPE